MAKKEFMNVLPDVYICPMKYNSVPLLPEGIVKCIRLAVQQIYRRCQLKNKVNLYYCKSKVSTETSDTTRYLKTFQIIPNEMPILPLILCRLYFSCLEMYSGNFWMFS